MMTFRLKLHCETCGAVIEYTNEKPKWQVDPDLQRDYDESAARVKEHADAIVSFFNTKIPPHVRLVSDTSLNGAILSGIPVLKDPPEARYVECPCCDGKAYCGSAWEEEGEKTP